MQDHFCYLRYLISIYATVIVYIVIFQFYCNRDFANSKFKVNVLNMNMLADTRYMLKQVQVTCLLACQKYYFTTLYFQLKVINNFK